MKAPLTFLFFILVVYNLTRRAKQQHPKTVTQTIVLPPVISNDQFIRVNNIQAINTSLLKNKGIQNMDAPVGDFLSRLWNYYGEPDSIEEEGFNYTFRDKETGLIFTAYCAGSGPAYGGDPRMESRLMPIIEKFDTMLSEGKNADCEITFDTDFGKQVSGSKDGIPYDRLITSN